MEQLNRFEKFFHNKTVIKAIFIFPLISAVIMAILLKGYIDLHPSLAYISEIRRLFTLVVGLLCVNVFANFSALILYYCLHNRLEDLKKRYKK